MFSASAEPVAFAPASVLVTGPARPQLNPCPKPDVVISALGVGKSLKSSGLIARSAPAIVRAMESNGVRRWTTTRTHGEAF